MAFARQRSRYEMVRPSSMDEPRPIVRCRRCKLNQFRTADDKCRRCSFGLPSCLPIILPEVTAPVPPGTWTIERLGPRIREIREAMGLTQAKVLERMGKSNSRSNLSYVEVGTRHPSIAYCEKIADALGVNLRTFFDESITVEDLFIREIIPYLHVLTPSQWQTVIALLRRISPGK